MPPNATAPPQATPALATGPTRLVAIAAGLVLGLVALWLASLVLALPPTVASLNVVNPSGAPVHATVAAANDDRVLGLGVIEPGGSITFVDVLDQGDDWTVLLRPPGADAPSAVLERSRTELADAGWQVVVPEGAAVGRS